MVSASTPPQHFSALLNSGCYNYSPKLDFKNMKLEKSSEIETQSRRFPWFCFFIPFLRDTVVSVLGLVVVSSKSVVIYSWQYIKFKYIPKNIMIFYYH